jgi:hypothetical protein
MAKKDEYWDLERAKREFMKLKRQVDFFELQARKMPERYKFTQRQLRPGQKGYIKHSKRLPFARRARRQLKARKRTALGYARKARTQLRTVKRKYGL